MPHVNRDLSSGFMIGKDSRKVGAGQFGRGRKELNNRYIKDIKTLDD